MLNSREKTLSQLELNCLRSLENSHTLVHQTIQDLKNKDIRTTKQKIRLMINYLVTVLENL